MAASGFMEAYDPAAAKLFHGSRDPHWIRNRELLKAERTIWDAAREDVRRLENGVDSTQSLLMQPLWLTPPLHNPRNESCMKFLVSEVIDIMWDGKESQRISGAPAR
jgi:hypothetical protein